MSGAHAGSRCVWQEISVLILVAAHRSVWAGRKRTSIRPLYPSFLLPPSPLTVSARGILRWTGSPRPQGAHTRRCAGLQVMLPPPWTFMMGMSLLTLSSSSTTCSSITELSQLVITALFLSVSWAKPCMSSRRAGIRSIPPNRWHRVSAQ